MRGAGFEPVIKNRNINDLGAITHYQTHERRTYRGRNWLR